MWAPVNSLILRLVLLGGLFLLWAGMLALARPRRLPRRLVLALPFLAAVPFLLPGREIDAAALRADDVSRMEALTGTPYFWGGESTRGIDCSGLPRKALRDALFAGGFRQANPAALRAGLRQWWFDASASALGEGYRGDTLPLGVEGVIATLDSTALRPGDLAVTTNGRHILAYLGNDRWIQADPGPGRVLSLNGRTDVNSWFHHPVTLHRWSLLK